MTRTVVVKATFQLQPGTCQLAEQQDPIAATDRHGDGELSQVIRAPSDLVPFKARADVLLVGSAFSPDPVRSLAVRLSVGEIDKKVELWSERGAVATRLLATGLGPLPASWAGRRALWTEPGEPSLARFAAEPVLERISKSYFNVAPPDQQTVSIRPRERIVLEHLHPDLPRLVTALPGVLPRAFVQPTKQEIALVGDTLLIDTDRQICTVTWRGQLDMLESDPPVRVVVEAEQEVEGFEASASMFNEETHNEDRQPRSAPPPLERSRASTLPFMRAAAPPVLPRAAEEPSPTSGATGMLRAAAPAGAPVTGPDWLRSGQRSAPMPQPPVSHPGPQNLAPAPPPASLAPHSLAPQNLAPQSGSVSPSQQNGMNVPAPAIAPLPPRVVATATPNPVSASGAPIPPAYVPALGKLAEPSPVQVPSHATVFGAEAASNAAVAASGAPAAEESAAPRRAQATSSQPLELVWFDPTAGRRIRIWWKDLLADLEFVSFDSKHELPTDDPDADKLRHEVFGVLTREPAIDPSGLKHVMSDAVDEDGRFTAPLVVLEAELRMQYADLARLELLIAFVAPLTAGDKRLKDLSDAGADVLKNGKAGAALMASRLCAQIREHHQQVHGKGQNAGALDADTDRALLDIRAYDQRTVLGAKRLRAVVGAAQDTLPAYLPEATRDSLPLVESFRARLIAEVHPRQDRAESHHLALRVVAVARLITLDGPRRP